jgi:hypothetical protein
MVTANVTATKMTTATIAKQAVTFSLSCLAFVRFLNSFVIYQRMKVNSAIYLLVITGVSRLILTTLLTDKSEAQVLTIIFKLSKERNFFLSSES